MEGVDLANDPDRGSRVSWGSNGGCGNYRFPEARAKSWRQSWRGAGLDNHGSCELWLGSLDSWPPPDAEHGARPDQARTEIGCATTGRVPQVSYAASRRRSRYVF